MSNQALLSSENFKLAFNQGLVTLLSRQSSGVFILALANSLQNKEIFESNSETIVKTFNQIKQNYFKCQSEKVKTGDAKDDEDVMMVLFDMGVNAFNITKKRSVKYGNASWQVRFNPLRSFRPKRMSGQNFSGLNIAFNEKGFHFDKAFLTDEIFIDQHINNKHVSLLYNKFPFADYHGLFVVDKHKHYNQFLFKEIFFYIFNLYQQLANHISGLVIAYNSLGAGASVNHLHFQSSITSDQYCIESKLWKHNGGNESYPVTCLVFETGDEGWQCIDYYQKTDTPFNIIIKSNKLYCLPRKDPGSEPEPMAWYQMAGNFVFSDNKRFSEITHDQIIKKLMHVGIDPSN